jgi:phenylpyruvate tautomerase PptA (4-oxalocrotonate tautomerase family)
MPVVVVEKKDPIGLKIKDQLALKITAVLRDVIKSPDDLISVVFHELPPDNTYRAGQRTDEALIFVHIRSGRSDEVVLSLLEAITDVWTGVTGEPDDAIELVVLQHPAKWVMRGRARLPEPPTI